MEHSTKSSYKPSAIPRLSRLPESSISVLSAISSEALNSTKVSSGTLKIPRLRQSASRDQIFASSDKSTPVTPRFSNLDLQGRKLSNGDAKYSYTPSRYPNSDDQVPRQQQQKISTREVGRNSCSPRSTELGFVKSKTIPNAQLSLSERAVETSLNIPSSPALRRRGSSYFNNDLKSTPNSRSNSRSVSSSNDGSNSVQGNLRSFKDGTEISQLANSSTPTKQSSKVGTSKHQSVPLPLRSNTPTSKLSITKSNNTSKLLKYGSKTVTSKKVEHRSSMQSLLRKPSASTLLRSKETNLMDISKRKPTAISSSAPNENVRSVSPKFGKVTAKLTVSGIDDKKLRKSSLVLREQIAKAKAMKRAASLQASIQASGQVDKETLIMSSDSFDFGPSNDPFSQNIAVNDPKSLLKKRIRSALTEGRLNISSMSLKEIPYEVLNMYSPQYMFEIGWGEVVDLVKFIAADNEIEELPDVAFPDVDFSDAIEDDEIKVGLFYGLESIELRGNKLTKVPLGLRRLSNLTSLNLSGNELTNECLHVISQISSLRDLTLDHNRLSGKLDIDLGKLKNLAILSLRQNEVSDLPERLVELTQLRVLNISENRFKSLPFISLSKLPLTELIASNNKLNDALISENVDTLPYLQVLDVSSNLLTSLSSSDIRLPALYKLLCASNKLRNLPSMITWTSLITIDAEDNSIETLPLGLVSLPKIRSVNLDRNQLRVLDENLGKVESLEILHVTGNPLREKKFLSMSTGDIKRTLLMRLEPEGENERDADADQVFLEQKSLPSSTFPVLPSSPTWVVQLSGVLDRSSTQSHSLNPVAAADIATKHKIKILQLHHNNFQVIPESVAFFATTLTNLNMSHNELRSDAYLNNSLELPELKELNLSSNNFNSLQPLIQNLQAPKLERLDISFNRLSSLPVLRNRFPKLTTLLASHNTIRDLLPESIKGMHVVDCSSNELDSVNIKIGLLGGREGLKHLDLRGNRFKVPKYSTLEKGTEATLAWLKGRIPVGRRVKLIFPCMIGIILCMRFEICLDGVSVVSQWGRQIIKGSWWGR